MFFFLYYRLLLFIIKEIKEQILNRCKCLSYLQCHVYIDTRSKLDSDNVLRRGVSLSGTLQVFSFPAIMNNPIIMTYKNQHLGLNGWMILKKNEACMQHSSLKTDSTVTILIHYHIRMISSKNEKVISMLVFKMHPYLLTTVCNYHTFVQFFPHSVTFPSPVSPEKDGFLLFFRFIRR